MDSSALQQLSEYLSSKTKGFNIYRCSYDKPSSSLSSTPVFRPARTCLSRCHLNLLCTSLSTVPAVSKITTRSGLINARMCSIEMRIHVRRVRMRGTRLGVKESSLRRSLGYDHSDLGSHDKMKCTCVEIMFPTKLGLFVSAFFGVPIPLRIEN